MLIDDKKEYLRKYRLQHAKIRRMREMIEECPENAEKYRLAIYKARVLRDKIECEIENVDGGLLTEILSQKYMCGKSMEEIGYCMNYSKRQIERLHIKALEAFEPQIDKE